MTNDLELSDNDLELVVSEKKLGSLETNALQIKELVEKSLPRFSIENYNSENIDKAKKDKATLNRAAKALNSKRIEIEKEFIKPFEPFKNYVAETIKLINECSAKIDSIVKEEENIYKTKKRESLLSYYNQKELSIPFEKIEKTEWMNKGEKESKIFVEIDSIAESIKQNLATISSMQDAEALTVYYKNCLDLNRTIQYSNQLIAERSAREEAERERKIAEEKELSLKETSNQTIKEPESEPESKEDEQNADPVVYVRTFKVECSRDQLIALGDWMNDNGIKFQKI